jgi:hypothetical protein
MQSLRSLIAEDCAVPCPVCDHHVEDCPTPGRCAIGGPAPKAGDYRIGDPMDKHPAHAKPPVEKPKRRKGRRATRPSEDRAHHHDEDR